jgi:hypothetical protein
MPLNKLLLRLFCFKNDKDSKKKGVVPFPIDLPLPVFLFPVAGSAVRALVQYSSMNPGCKHCFLIPYCSGA